MKANIRLSVVFCLLSSWAAAADYFVDANNGDDSQSGTSWATAKRTLAAAVGASDALDTIWATDGVYDGGGMATPGGSWSNRVVLDARSLRAAEGCSPVIDGGDAMRCAFLTNGATIAGFTLRNGRADLGDESSANYLNNAGGAVFIAGSGYLKSCEVAASRATRGGGVYNRGGGRMYRCVVASNSATLYGGGIYFFKDGRAENSYFTQNQSATNGGALYFYQGGEAVNCTTRNNSAGTNGNELDFVDGGTVRNCVAWNPDGAIDRPGRATLIEYTCATDGVTNGINNCFTNNPLFVGTENELLATNSPCVDAGNNTYAASTDRVGSERIFNGTVDLGSLEMPGTSHLQLPDHTFSVVLNGAPEQKTLYLENTKNAVAKWSLASAPPAWLSISPAAGEIAGERFQALAFTANPAGLAAGTYASTNLFAADSADGICTQRITLVVSDADLFIASHDFSAVYGGESTGQDLALTNRGTATADWTLSSGAPWLTISPMAGTLSAGSQTNLSYTADPAGLQPGTYWATNIFDAPTMDGSFTQLVSLTVQSSNLKIEDIETRAARDSGTTRVYVNLTNEGSAAASWTLEATPPDWVEISPTNGSLEAGESALLIYHFHSDNLETGTYATTNIFSSDTSPGAATQAVVFVVYYNDYFVSVDGDDTNAGTNWATAKRTIQAGVDAQETANGCVYVSNGVYRAAGRIEVDGVVLESLAGPEQTIVDGGGTSACFIVYDHAVLDGFSIRNGHADGDEDWEQSGGGVYAYQATVKNCTFENNWARRVGGGLAAEENSEISNCRFAGNTVEGIAFYGGAGGGASIRNASLTDCSFLDNTADYGGGLALSNASISSVSFSNNTANINGGGLFVQNGLNLQDLVFNGNEASENGGALYFNDGGTLYYGSFTNNIAGENGGAIYIADNSNTDPYEPAECWHVNLHRNHAGRYGGGAYLWHGGMITRSTLSGNSAEINGGGAAFRLSGGIYNSEISGNTASTNGGGVYFSEGGYLRESKVLGNRARRGAGIYHNQGGDTKSVLLAGNQASVRGGAVYCYKGGTLNGITTANNSAAEKGSGFYAYNLASNATQAIQLENSIVWEETDPIYRSGSAIALDHICSNESYTNGIGHLIQQDPRFLDPTAGNYQLSAASPCIDAGTNTNTRTYDLARNARIMNGTIDLGAYEWDYASDTDGDGMPDAWEEEYFGGSTNAVAEADADGDAVDNYCEFVAGTDPQDATAYLRITQMHTTPDANDPGLVRVDLEWNPSIGGRIYGIGWSTNLVDGFEKAETWLPAPSSHCTLSNRISNAFYRINVQLDN